VLPVNSTQFMSSEPSECDLRSTNISATIACRRRPQCFIGFQVDVPYSKVEGRFDWFTNVPSLPTARVVGIDWTSSNLNQSWFGGSRFIPNKDTCYGAAWRKLIVDGLMRASTLSC